MIGNRTVPVHIKHIDIPTSGFGLRPWKDVIQSLFPDGKVQKAVTSSITEKFAHESSTSDTDYKFRGSPHCEAVLATLPYLAVCEMSSEVLVPTLFVHRLMTEEKIWGLCKPSLQVRPCSRAFENLLSGVRVYINNSLQQQYDLSDIRQAFKHIWMRSSSRFTSKHQETSN